MEGGRGAVVGAVIRLAREVVDVRCHALCFLQADADGHPRQPAGVLLHGACVAGERGVAQLRVERGLATVADELGVFGGGGGGGRSDEGGGI